MQTTGMEMGDPESPPLPEPSTSSPPVKTRQHPLRTTDIADARKRRQSIVKVISSQYRPMRKGCFRRLRIGEDNARFILLGIVLLLYLLIGAIIFMVLESEEEQRLAAKYWQRYEQFEAQVNNGTVQMSDVVEFMEFYGVVRDAGVLNNTRARWDFMGSFHFVSTIVSTIGYGATAPRTVAGKVMVMWYGFLGCSGGILFFNLFLERIITFLAFLLRSYHVRELKAKHRTFRERAASNAGQGLDTQRRKASIMPSSSDEDLDFSLESWKPSVYWVMLCLLGIAVIIACCVSAMYSPLEGWTYLESIYFCFVTFATIGFGDLVSAQKLSYPNEALYHIGNFVCLTFGCCCIYSLFNVISIVIKQVLNWLILKLDNLCKFEESNSIAGPRLGRRGSAAPAKKKKVSPDHLGRRFPKPSKLGKTSGRSSKSRKHKRRGLPGVGAGHRSGNGDFQVDAMYDSESDHGSNEMISTHMRTNKFSLAVLQKQLCETAHMCRTPGSRTIIVASHTPPGQFTPGTVGPLAIVSQKLGESV